MRATEMTRSQRIRGNIAAACGTCGGWSSCGGMSHLYHTAEGCTCNKSADELKTFTQLFLELTNYHVGSPPHEAAKKELRHRFVQMEGYAPVQDVYIGNPCLKTWAGQKAASEK